MGGTYVGIDSHVVDDPDPGHAGGDNLLHQSFTNAFADAETWKTTAIGYLDELIANYDSLSITDDWKNYLDNVVFDDVGEVFMNFIDSPTTSTLPSFNGISFPIAGALKEAPDLDTTIDEPTEPVEINPDLNWDDDVPYTSEGWLTLFNAVNDGIVNGGQGLGEEAEQAIWERGRNRQDREAEESYNKAIQGIEVRGLKYPQIAVNALQKEIAKRLGDQRTDLNRDITVKQAELVNSNSKFFIDKGMDLEQMVRNFFISTRQLSLEAKKAIAQIAIQTYAEKIKAYLAKYDGQIKKIQAGIAGIEAVTAQNKNIVEIFKGKADVAVAEVEAVAKERESIVNSDKVQSDIYKTSVDAEAVRIKSDRDVDSLKLEKGRLELQKASEYVKTLLDSSVSLNTLRQSMIGDAGKISAQALAAAYHIVTASIGHSTSSSESVSESWGHSESLGETHTFDETKTD